MDAYLRGDEQPTSYWMPSSGLSQEIKTLLDEARMLPVDSERRLDLEDAAATLAESECVIGGRGGRGRPATRWHRWTGVAEMTVAGTAIAAGGYAFSRMKTPLFGAAKVQPTPPRA